MELVTLQFNVNLDLQLRSCLYRLFSYDRLLVLALSQSIRPPPIRLPTILFLVCSIVACHSLSVVYQGSDS
jgi:hypothetical protein